MGNIFDGIQRPLKQIAVDSASCFIPRGVDVPALDRSLTWEFEPTKFKVGWFLWAARLPGPQLEQRQCASQGDSAHACAAVAAGALRLRTRRSAQVLLPSFWPLLRHWWTLVCFCDCLHAACRWCAAALLLLLL